MGGCGTRLDGRAIFEVTENGGAIHEYDGWVKNYIKVEQAVAEGRFTREQADWSGVTIYIKPAGAAHLDEVTLRREELPDGKVRMFFTEWDSFDDEDVPYTVKGKPLEFTFDPNEGLTRYTLTLVHRKYETDPIPESWNGTLFWSEDCPLRFIELPAGTWAWVDEHTLDAGVDGDMLVTPHGQDPGVENPIASREIVIRKSR